MDFSAFCFGDAILYLSSLLLYFYKDKLIFYCSTMIGITKIKNWHFTYLYWNWISWYTNM